VSTSKKNHQNKFHWTHFALSFAGIAPWVGSIFLISEIIYFDFNLYQIFKSLFFSLYFWVALVLLLTMTVGRDVYSCAVERHFNFEPFHIVQEADAKHHVAKRIYYLLQTLIHVYTCLDMNSCLQL